MNPKVSIIIPVYNGSNYLREAIESALAQTYQNIEVIVVNDGSDDSGTTEEIARSFGRRIRYFQKENGGVSSALNLGIKEMTGEYFSWLSHDDIYYPEKVGMQVHFLLDNPSLKAAFSNSEIMDAAGITQYVQKTGGPMIIKGPIHALQTWIFACALLVHRSCFEKTGLFNEHNKTTQDTEFVMNLLHYFPVGHLRQVLVRRRDHEGCGYRRLRELNLHEFDALLRNLMNKRGITYFFPQLALTSHKEEATAYDMLGDMTAHAGVPFSRYCYELSSGIWDSPFNPARFKKTLGFRAAYFYSRLSTMLRALLTRTWR